jgi:hypothetical protein
MKMEACFAVDPDLRSDAPGVSNSVAGFYEEYICGLTDLNTQMARLKSSAYLHVEYQDLRRHLDLHFNTI